MNRLVDDAPARAAASQDAIRGAARAGLTREAAVFGQDNGIHLPDVQRLLAFDRQTHARAAAGASRHGAPGQPPAADVRELRHREDRTRAMRRRQGLLRLHDDYPHCKTTMTIRVEAVDARNMKAVVPRKRLLWPQAVGHIRPSCDQTGRCRLTAVAEWRRAARAAVQAQRS